MHVLSLDCKGRIFRQRSTFLEWFNNLDCYLGFDFFEYFLDLVLVMSGDVKGCLMDIICEVKNGLVELIFAGFTLLCGYIFLLLDIFINEERVVFGFFVWEGFYGLPQAIHNRLFFGWWFFILLNPGLFNYFTYDFLLLNISFLYHWLWIRHFTHI